MEGDPLDTLPGLHFGAGMTSAITNPMHPEVMQAVSGADVLVGNDPDCLRWISRYRELAGEGELRARQQRRGRRRRSAA